MKQQILIFGSDVERCKTLKYALQSNLTSAYYALSLDAAMRHLIRYEDQLVIVTATAPIPDLERALESIRKARSVPILVLTPIISADEIVKVLTIADDILLEPYNMEVFRAKVQASLRRFTYDSQQNTPGVLSKDGTLLIDAQCRKVYVLEVEITLPRKQYELLYFLASHEGRVFTHQQIYQTVWGEDLIYSSNAPLSCQMRKLRRKLGGIQGAPQYLQTIKGVGYRFDTDKQ